MWINEKFVGETMHSKAKPSPEFTDYGIDPEEMLPMYHPDCLLGAKVSSRSTGATGRVVRVNAESRKEDRYDSLDIEWDHGLASRAVFICYFLNDARTPVLDFLVDDNRLAQFKIA